jgi:hypothetical protein
VTQVKTLEADGTGNINISGNLVPAGDDAYTLGLVGGPVWQCILLGANSQIRSDGAAIYFQNEAGDAPNGISIAALGMLFKDLITPNASGEGAIGTSTKPVGDGFFCSLQVGAQDGQEIVFGKKDGTNSNIRFLNKFAGDGYTYVQAGSGTADAAAKVTFCRYGTSDSALAAFRIYATSIGLYGGVAAPSAYIESLTTPSMYAASIAVGKAHGFTPRGPVWYYLGGYSCNQNYKRELRIPRIDYIHLRIKIVAIMDTPSVGARTLVSKVFYLTTFNTSAIYSQSSYVDEIMEGGTLIAIGDWSYDSDNDELVLPIYTNVNSRTYTLYAEVFGRNTQVFDSATIGAEISESFPGVTPAVGMMKWPTPMYSSAISIQASGAVSSQFSVSPTSGYSGQLPLMVSMAYSNATGTGVTIVYARLSDNSAVTLFNATGTSSGTVVLPDYQIAASVGSRSNIWIRDIVFSIAGAALTITKVWNASIVSYVF